MAALALLGRAQFLSHLIRSWLIGLGPPLEGKVLAGSAVILVGVVKADGVVLRDHAPRRDLSRADLGAGRVGGGDPPVGVGGRAGQGLHTYIDLSRDLRTPVGQIVGGVEGDGRVLDASQLTDEAAELTRPSLFLAGEDLLERAPLFRICLLVDEFFVGVSDSGPSPTWLVPLTDR